MQKFAMRLLFLWFVRDSLWCVCKAVCRNKNSIFTNKRLVSRKIVWRTKESGPWAWSDVSKGIDKKTWRRFYGMKIKLHSSRVTGNYPFGSYRFHGWQERKDRWTDVIDPYFFIYIHADVHNPWKTNTFSSHRPFMFHASYTHHFFFHPQWFK